MISNRRQAPGITKDPEKVDTSVKSMKIQERLGRQEKITILIVCQVHHQPIPRQDMSHMAHIKAAAEAVAANQETRRME
jgi:uncharacterized protein YdgA (DUF945 family)